MTIASEHILYVHGVPKTGGSWTKEVFRVLLREKRIPGLGGHTPAWSIPGVKRGGRRSFGTVRDPLTWYCSLYDYSTKGHPGSQHGMVATYGGGSVDFRDFLYGVTHPAKPRVPDVFGVIWKPDGATRDDLIRSGLGLCTWAHLHGYGQPMHRAGQPRKPSEWHVDALVPTSRLAEGVAAVTGLSAGMLRSMPPINHNLLRHRTPYRDRYDPEMLSWVTEADELMYDIFGLCPWEPAPQAVYSF